MDNIESIDQAQRAQMLTNGDDPSAAIQFFPSRSQPTYGLDQQQQSSRKIFPVFSPVAQTPISVPVNPAAVEKDKYTKMKQRKEVKKERAEKKVKTFVITDGDPDNYNIDNVLQELGEVNSDYPHSVF